MADEQDSDSEVVFNFNANHPGREDEEVIGGDEGDHNNRFRGPGGRRQAPSVKLDPYTGEEDWDQYISYFEDCAELAQWTETEKLLYLATSIKQQARLYYSSLPVYERRSYRILTARLEQRFGSKRQAARWLSKIHTRTRGKEESVTAFGDDIRSYAQKAYVSLDPDAQEMLALEHFYKSVTPEMRCRLMDKDCRTIREAVEIVERYEDVLGRAKTCAGASQIRVMSSNEDGTGQTKPDNVESSMDLDDIRVAIKRIEGRLDTLERRDRKVDTRKTCFTCGSGDHLYRDCPKRGTQSDTRGDSFPTQKGNLRTVSSLGHKLTDDVERRHNVSYIAPDNRESLPRIGQIGMMQRTIDNGLYVTGIINNTEVTFLLDSGATTSVISKETYDRSTQDSNLPLYQKNCNVQGVNGTYITVHGYIETRVSLGTYRTLTNIMVGDISDQGILGQDFMRKHIKTWNMETLELCTKDGNVIQCFNGGVTERICRVGISDSHDEELHFGVLNETDELISVGDMPEQGICYPITLETDVALIEMRTWKAPKGQVAGRLQELDTCNLKVVHQSGRSHLDADVLSRKPYKEVCEPLHQEEFQEAFESSTSIPADTFEEEIRAVRSWTEGFADKEGMVSLGSGWKGGVRIVADMTRGLSKCRTELTKPEDIRRNKTRMKKRGSEGKFHRRIVERKGVKRKQTDGTQAEKTPKRARKSIDRNVDGFEEYEDDIEIDCEGGSGDTEVSNGKRGDELNGKRQQGGGGFGSEEKGQEGRENREKETIDEGRRPVGGGDERKRKDPEHLSDTESTSSFSSMSTESQTTTTEGAGGIRARAFKILRRGAMPMCPPARRDWGKVDELRIELRNTVVTWPPANWRELSPDQRLMAHEFAAMSLERRDDSSHFPIISRRALLDKYAFLSLDGEGRSPEELDCADKVDGKIRQYNGQYLRSIGRGEVSGTRISLGILRNLEGTDRWTDTDAITELLDRNGVRIKL